MAADLQKLFDSWAALEHLPHSQKQWLLSKWEVQEGVDWPQEKIQLMCQTIVADLELSQGLRMVELGCGGGWILNSLKPLVRQALGVDFSINMLRHAQKIYPAAPLICGQMGELPFRDSFFDRVLCYFVFINIEDDRAVQRNILDIFRILKKGGRALVGQLPDGDRSADYDAAKRGYGQYCQQVFKIGKNYRDVCPMPQKLFNRKRIVQFLRDQNIGFEVRDSFNPFYRSGETVRVPWRFDLILMKN